MLRKAPTTLLDVEPHLLAAMDAWMNSDLRPRLEPEVEARWNGYIKWIQTQDLPLFVRVGKGKDFEKGCSISPHGRILIRCDNSPAQWIFRLALDKSDLQFADLRAAWERRTIPFGMVISLTASKRPDFLHVPALSQGSRVGGTLGWELSHRRPVRLKGRVGTATSQAFENHFRLLMSVGNMILTPSDLGMNHLVDWYFRKRPELAQSTAVS